MSDLLVQDAEAGLQAEVISRARYLGISLDLPGLRRDSVDYPSLDTRMATFVLDRFDISIDTDWETGGYWASIPDMPGCFATGRSLKDLFSGLADAIELYEESRAELRG